MTPETAARFPNVAIPAHAYLDRAGEVAIHIAVVTLLRRAAVPGLIYWHTPNGELRDKRQAAKLKAMGVLPGVSDLIVSFPDGRLAFLELKARRGALSDAQRTFLAAMAERGHAVAVARSVNEAEAILRGWGALRCGLEDATRTDPCGAARIQTSPPRTSTSEKVTI